MTQEEEIYRGDRAKRLLEDEIFIEAFDTIQKNLTERWALSKSEDIEGRENAWKMLKILSEVKRHILTVADTGKMAILQKEEESKIKKMGTKLKSMFG